MSVLRYMGKCSLPNVMYHLCYCYVLIVRDILERAFPHIPHILIVNVYNIMQLAISSIAFFIKY